MSECERPCIYTGQFDAGCRCQDEAKGVDLLLLKLRQLTITPLCVTRPEYVMEVVEEAIEHIVRAEEIIDNLHYEAMELNE